MNHTELKPQTPLTDAVDKAHHDSPDTIGFGYMKMLEHARSLELKLQKAKLWIEKSNTAQYCAELEEKLKEAERQRDEAILKIAAKPTWDDVNAEIRRCNCVLAEKQELKAERDQAIKERDKAIYWVENYKDLYDEKKKQWFNSVTCVCSDMPNVAHYIKQLESERDQLIKVVDDAVNRLEITNAAWINDLGCYPLPYGTKRHIRDHLQANEKVVADHSLLPHAQAKKGNKE